MHVCVGVSYYLMRHANKYMSQYEFVQLTYIVLCLGLSHTGETNPFISNRHTIKCHSVIIGFQI